MSTESFSERLTSIWHQGGRDLAVTFLRRAVTLDNTLAELVAAFQFDGVKDHLQSIHLKEILAPQPRQVQTTQSAAAPTVVPARQRRTRRSSDEMRQLKNRLLGLLEQEAPSSLDTVQLMSVLRKDGHRVDTILVNGLLKLLEDEGRVSNLGGKPKSWRAVAQKSAAEPATLTIKKAQHDLASEA